MADRAMSKWILRGAGLVALLVALAVVLIAVGAFWLRGRMQAALPVMEGQLPLAGLEAPVTVTRDDLGIPTIRGESRLDVARATGFLHGQERFFQMDLLRRRAAGELAELVGERMLEEDRSHRIHRLRARAERRWSRAPVEERELLEAYSEGVNAGLEALGSVPFEYLVLRAEPRPWSPVDSYMVVLTMFLELHDEEGRGESAIGLMQDLYPQPFFDFLAVQGTPWDAPVVGEAWPVPPIPAPEVRDPRSAAVDEPVDVVVGGRGFEVDELPLAPASNAWAVAGDHTVSGNALLAADLHLHLSVPNIWYRAVFTWSGPDGRAHRVVGATLPGAPLMVLGSNGHVAWGLTDSQVDTNDLILLETDPDDPDRYRTPDGMETVERFTEILRIAGGEEERLEFAWTRWGPILGPDHRGRLRAFRWVAYEDDALDFRFRGLETVSGIEDALDVAQRSGLPALNILVADREGRIGWTLAGRLPRRIGFSGRVPTSWAGGEHRWDGLLPPDEVPRKVDPASGRLWSANQRMVGEEMLAKLGDDGYALGARARQIRDRLRALSEPVSEIDMLAIQLDDRALLMEPWRDVFLEALTPEALEDRPLRAEARRFIEVDWNGRASVDSVGYRLVAGAHLFLVREVFSFLTSACEEADPEFLYYGEVAQHEGPLWKLVEERPLHMLTPRYESWDEQLLAALDTAVDYLIQQSGDLSEATWGARNTAAIFHPLALPGLRGFLGMPPDPLPGDVYMPRLQTPTYGSSQRMVVAPGQEDRGLFHMPAGQSGNPLSPHFRDGHQAWVEGEPTPLVPGEPIHVLTLEPVI